MEKKKLTLGYLFHVHLCNLKLFFIILYHLHVFHCSEFGERSSTSSFRQKEKCPKWRFLYNPNKSKVFVFVFIVVCLFLFVFGVFFCFYCVCLFFYLFIYFFFFFLGGGGANAKKVPLCEADLSFCNVAGLILKK